MNCEIQVQIFPHPKSQAHPFKLTLASTLEKMNPRLGLRGSVALGRGGSGGRWGWGGVGLGGEVGMGAVGIWGMGGWGC